MIAEALAYVGVISVAMLAAGFIALADWRDRRRQARQREALAEAVKAESACTDDEDVAAVMADVEAVWAGAEPLPAEPTMRELHVGTGMVVTGGLQVPVVDEGPRVWVGTKAVHRSCRDARTNGWAERVCAYCAPVLVGGAR